jgi:hypothetical protein
MRYLAANDELFDSAAVIVDAFTEALAVDNGFLARWFLRHHQWSLHLPQPLTDVLHHGHVALATEFATPETNTDWLWWTLLLAYDSEEPIAPLSSFQWLAARHRTPLSITDALKDHAVDWECFTQRVLFATPLQRARDVLAWMRQRDGPAAWLTFLTCLRPYLNDIAPARWQMLKDIFMTRPERAVLDSLVR